MSFMGFAYYIAVRCGFDKHLYLTSCLNAHNHNTRIRLPQTGNNPSDSITEIVRLEQFDYYNQKQNKVLYINMENMDFLPPTAPSLVFARETCMPY